MDRNEFEKAKKKALRLLSFRPRTEQEVIFRLENTGFSRSAIKETVNFLKEYDFINDRVFAREWIRYRLKKGTKGKYYLYSELLNKGVSKDLAEEVIGSITDEDEYSILISTAKNKIKKGCSKYALVSYLERQGFSRELIYKSCRELFDE